MSDGGKLIIPNADEVPYHIIRALEKAGIEWYVVDGDLDKGKTPRMKSCGDD